MVMKKIMYLILFLTSVYSLNAQEYTQDNEATKVTFKIKNFGSYVSGSFSEVMITSSFDTKELTNSYINATINVSSINTNNSRRDKHLGKEEYFNINNYNTITLQSIKIEKQSAIHYSLIANLTIKAITKQVKIPLELIETENSIKINANFDLNRLDYSVGEDSWILSDIVKIAIVYHGKK